jgi:hypothetical protein
MHLDRIGVYVNAVSAVMRLYIEYTCVVSYVQFTGHKELDATIIARYLSSIAVSQNNSKQMPS